MEDQHLSHPPTLGEDEEAKRRGHRLLELEFGATGDFDDPAHEWRRLPAAGPEHVGRGSSPG